MEYRVLARKYRPSRFEDLIGQDVLVRTLTNAITTDRLAHAYLLTGIRGIGKTTTARIIARALNCIGADGLGEHAVITPCGVCAHCTMIAEDRHVDVLEMDAASRTGVSDMREVIDAVRYLPSSARYKIYIIDEVHMLSSSAFNALLKTLEEPPPHVKFIFATTEIRKIPVTIISRCQRFDLKRVDVAVLAGHLKNVAEKEAIAAEDEALRLIAVAAEGSVRDALSMLDQAAALAIGCSGDKTVTSGIIREMLGLADKMQSFRLLDPLLSGDAPAALKEWEQMHVNGADPLMALQDLMELVHLLTRMKLAPDYFKTSDLPETDRVRGQALADRLSLPVLTRLWQMLLKGVQEVRYAPDPAAATEMMLIRIAHAASLPLPEELMRSLKAEAGNPAPRAEKISVSAAPAYASQGSAAMQTESTPSPARPTLALVQPQESVDNFEALVALFETHKEAVLHSYLTHHVRLVRFSETNVVLNPVSALPSDFTRRAGQLLTQWTGTPWTVTLTKETGRASLAEQEATEKQHVLAEAQRDPMVEGIFRHFPDARLVDVKNS